MNGLAGVRNAWFSRANNQIVQIVGIFAGHNPHTLGHKSGRSDFRNDGVRVAEIPGWLTLVKCDPPVVAKRLQHFLVGHFTAHG